MNKEKILASTVAHVKSEMSEEGTGHDWWHVYRVWQTSLLIAKGEGGADLFIVQLGSLLHDIADWKFNDEDEGGRVAGAWLKKAGADPETIEKVCHIVDNVSFKGARVKNKMKSKEGKIVQDADRLDALGAIGIARAFAYGGYSKRQLYDPDLKPTYHKSFETYKNNRSTTINHFYEKALLLKGMMNTRTGKRLAKERDAFMRRYLKEFLEEWKGNL